MPSPRPRVRVNHLTFGHAMKHMLQERQFTAVTIMEKSGLSRSCVYDLLRSFRGLGLIRQVDKQQDRTGHRRIEVFELIPQGAAS